MIPVVLRLSSSGRGLNIVLPAGFDLIPSGTIFTVSVEDVLSVLNQRRMVASVDVYPLG